MEADLAHQTLRFLLKPIGCRPAGTVGFVSASDFPSSAARRVPDRKLRMRFFERDNYRCRVCGRYPGDHLDLELQVHHIRPWSDGGATIEDNLITLCGTCHGGLDPHFNHALFDLIGANKHVRNRASRLIEIQRYRAWVASHGTVDR
jgi:hypothetical protein